MFYNFIKTNQIQQSFKSLNSIKMNEAMVGGEDDEMALSEHIEEFSQRLVFGIVLVCAILLCFAIKRIVQLFQAPAVGEKFLQFAPGEYFFASVKIASFCGILVTSPIILYQLLCI